MKKGHYCCYYSWKDVTEGVGERSASEILSQLKFACNLRTKYIRDSSCCYRIVPNLQSFCKVDVSVMKSWSAALIHKVEVLDEKREEWNNNSLSLIRRSFRPEIKDDKIGSRVYHLCYGRFRLQMEDCMKGLIKLRLFWVDVLGYIQL